jgi:hypothetical protein
MNQNNRSERYLLRLKLALAAGGLAVTILGAGLLGQGGGALTNDPTPGATVETSVTTNVEISDPDELDLNLEAIPTVAAPTFSNRPLAFGRSSG